VTLDLLLQLAVIVAGGGIAAGIARAVGLSPAVGQMIMGFALGPSFMGWIAPGAFAFVFGAGPAEPLAWLARAGLMLLMFQIGLEFDLSHLAHARNRRVVVAVAAAALAAPFALGLGFGRATAAILSPGIEPWAAALFVATAFSITALPILGRILKELGIQRTELGVIAIGAAAVNDVGGWIMLAAVSAFAASPTGPMLVLGAFGAGVLLHRRAAFVAAWDARVGPAVAVLLLPLYFTYTGLRTDAGSLDGAAAWAWCAAVLAAATLGKLGATYAAARWAGLAHAPAAALGAMMNTRGLVELVVLNIGYDLGLISRPLFTMLVLMAIASTAITTPLLRRWLPRS
jgi:Kef-type K+ transport system membrane component KefB